MAAERRPKPRYLVIEYEPQPDHDNLAVALEHAQKAQLLNCKHGYAVVELIAVVSSEHKTNVTRIK